MKDSIDEIVDFAFQDKYSLANMQQLRRAFTNDVNAKHVERITMKNKLETAGGIAADLTAGNLPVVGHAHFIGHILVGQLLFGLADETDLGNGVNAKWKVARI